MLNLSRPTNHDAEVSTCRRPRDSHWFQPPYFGSGKHAGLLRQQKSRVDKIRVFTDATANEVREVLGIFISSCIFVASLLLDRSTIAAGQLEIAIR